MIMNRIYETQNLLSLALWMGWSGIRIQVVTRYFSSPQLLDRLCGPPSLPFKGYRCSSSGVKWSERDGSHSPPSNANRMNVAIVSASVSTNCDLQNSGVPQDEDMRSVKGQKRKKIQIFLLNLNTAYLITV